MDTKAFYLALSQRLAEEGSCDVYTDPASGEKSFSPMAGAIHQRLSRRPVIHLYGGGHVSAALARVLHGLDFAVTVQDDRPEFVTAERFPHAQLCCGPFEELPPFPAGDYAVIMTRGHQGDYLCLRQLLRRKCGYLGMIGSRAKVAATARRLTEDGFTQDEINSVHSPVGLWIGAKTPAEIAVSIAAQIIEVFRATTRDDLDSAIVGAITALESSAVLVSVLEKKGSSPGDVGARMLVGPEGPITGTVGGGAVEAQAIRQATALCGGGKPAVVDYDLSNSQAASLGMICGGHVRMLFECL